MVLKGKLAAFEYGRHREPLEPYFDLPETSDLKIERRLESELPYGNAETVKELTEYLESLFSAKMRLEQLNGRWIGIEVLNRPLSRAERFKLATHVLTGLGFRKLWIGKRYQYGVYFRLDSEKRSWRTKGYKKGGQKRDEKKI